MDPAAIDKVLLMLVSGVSAVQAQAVAVEKMGQTPAVAVKLVAEARRRLTVAADYDRDEQVNTAYLRLNDLYARSLKVQDVKTALAAQKELSKLLALYASAGPLVAAGPVGDGADAAAARAHLIGLGLAADDAPLAELARLAVLRLCELEGRPVAGE